MKDSSKKEMAFYLMLGCVVLSGVVIFKTQNYWYVGAMIISGLMAIWARWKYTEALEKEQGSP